MGTEAQRPPEAPRDRRTPAGAPWRVLPAVAALLFVVLAGDAARRETPTLDEFAHVAAAHALWAHGELELYGKSPPLGRALLAAPAYALRDVTAPPVRERPFGWGPWQYGTRFMKRNAPDYLAIVASARGVVVALSLLTAGLVFLWCRDLFGERAAAISTSLLMLSPTVLAHGHLATLDVAATASMLASVLALRWASRGEALGRMAAAGAVFGAALLVKFTALLLVPATAILLALRRGRHWPRASGEFAVVGGVALLVVNVGMGFQGSFTSLGDYEMASGFGKSLQEALPASLPVPLPRPYVRGFDAQKLDVEQAEFPSYLRGEWSKEGWPFYEAIALAVKEPLPLLALLAIVPFVLARRRLARDELAFLLVPPLVVGTLLIAFNALNVGIRYLLPLYPFACVAFGCLFDQGARLRAAGLAAVAWCALSALWVHPGHLGSFNLAAGGPSAGHRWLLDSNFDWGQDLYRLPEALEALGVDEPISLLYFGHVDPALYGIDFRRASREPERAVVAASVSYLKGFAYPSPAPGGLPERVMPGHLAWLADHEPVMKLGSIWVFDTRTAP